MMNCSNGILGDAGTRFLISQKVQKAKYMASFESGLYRLTNLICVVLPNLAYGASSAIKDALRDDLDK